VLGEKDQRALAVVKEGLHQDQGIGLARNVVQTTLLQDKAVTAVNQMALQIKA